MERRKKNFFLRLEDFGFDTSKHDFLFPDLVIYDMEASLPAATNQPAVKRQKMCSDISYSLATNIPGATSEFFECRDGDRNDSITKLV